MTEQTGVGMNGEPDDFAARYDRMVAQSARPRMMHYVVLAAAALAILFLVFQLS